MIMNSKLFLDWISWYLSRIFPGHNSPQNKRKTNYDLHQIIYMRTEKKVLQRHCNNTFVLHYSKCIVIYACLKKNTILQSLESIDNHHWEKWKWKLKTPLLHNDNNVWGKMCWSLKDIFLSESHEIFQEYVLITFHPKVKRQLIF